MNRLFELYAELQTTHDELLKRTKSVYDDYALKVEFEDLLRNKVAYEVLFLEESIHAAISESKKKIKSFLVEPAKFNQTKIENIFRVRLAQLSRLVDSVSIDRIGTTLNVLSEFFHDVEIDFERNRVD